MPDKSYKRAPAADFVLPFDLPDVGLRGRLVRLEAAATQALGAHALPERAGRMAGEMLALSAILGTSLKLDGRLTIQTKSDGPLDLVTADYYGAQHGRPIGLRGYGQLDTARFATLDPNAGFDTLVGDGMLAITIEPRAGGQTYQGVVELNPAGIAASAEHYFSQSEQLPTVLKLAAAPLYLPGRKEPTWRAGGIMLQATPDGAGEGGDDWERLSGFLATVEDMELLDTELAAERLLWRLFHEDETRVLPFERVEFRCGCDTGRIATVLKSYPMKERQGLADPDGMIRARCEFCGKVHEVDPKALDAAPDEDGDDEA
ncbi:MAG: Hsp33 family molecular chaperone HslO [Alphaproteobacteria bacterium]|nr:Hsp33 family molecular chaperone HslO [Alphaproteobacteria bacterium]MBL6937070.1 Hsp33 family molecular chaperone HslO [Alphaproteobacteria bacterium]MBL7096368.1 Hsp33 family molecular chaperone HslO [Alphaproteobacteria bacterium]